MSRLCRLKTSSHGDDGKWAYEEIVKLRAELSALKTDSATAWAQAHRLALELECLLLDTKDNAIVSKWWDSGMAALDEYQRTKPGAAEEAQAWFRATRCATTPQ